MPPDSNPPLSPDLLDALADENVVLFVGNDGPLGFAEDKAPPSRPELAAALARTLNVPAGDSLAALAWKYEASRGRQALHQRVIDLLDAAAYRPAALHEQIAAAPFRAILTTAQDRLLERAFDSAGRAYATVLTDVETPYIDEQKVMIYKLLGCVSRPASLIVTDDDQILLTQRLRSYLNVLRYLFVTRPLLFINYSLGDVLFKTLFHEATANVDEHRRRAYAAWPEASPDLRDWWAKRSLILLPHSAGELLEMLAREAGRRERAVAAGVPTGPLTKPPYKFLDYYDTDDRDIFYGRQIESVRFFRLALSHRLTVLFGASGAGKTSLLKAGVLPLLHEQGYATAYVRALDDPLAAIRAEVLRLLHEQGRIVHDPGTTTLRDFFRAVLDSDERWVIVLDQFEEFFLRLGDPVRRRFWAELAAFRDLLPPLLTTAHPERSVAKSKEPSGDAPAGWGGEVRFILSLREDYLAPLDEARAHIPELLGQSYRLTNLSDDKASTVITEPAARAGLTVAPDLVSTLLDDLREAGAIAPPQLQIVCDRLYRDCLADPESSSLKLARQTLTLDDYGRLGKAQGILRDYVKAELARLPDEAMRNTARDLLKVLVTTRATKAALDRESIWNGLAETGALEAANALAVTAAEDTLERLVNRRLVREFERGNLALYELAHDHLALEIHSWIDEGEMQAKLARELLRRELETWHSARLPIPLEALKLIGDQREGLHRLTAEELELLLRSALSHGYEAAYWADRARAGGVPVEDIALEGLKSENFRARSAAVTVLSQLGERFINPLIEMLRDLYPQVRVAAIMALERLQSTGEWRKHLKDECYVPAGTFIMGANKQAHEVFARAFYIGRYPVTNIEYKRYRDSVGRPFEFEKGKDHHPVVSVSWYDSRDYALWAEMRLLTEAEWEKAASWGISPSKLGPLKYDFPWGNRLFIIKTKPRTQRIPSNTKESKIDNTTPVGRFSPEGDSSYGVIDMAGNVWEWTSSLRKNYPYRFGDGREDVFSSDLRVLRGGSFKSEVASMRTTFRKVNDPNERFEDVGVRIGFSITSDPINR